MTINNEIIIEELPIRFFPEANQGLKSWLTGTKRELYTIKDMTDYVQIQNNSIWPSPGAAEDLLLILLRYKGLKTQVLQIEIPRKYEKLVDFSKFIVE